MQGYWIQPMRRAGLSEKASSPYWRKRLWNEPIWGVAASAALTVSLVFPPLLCAEELAGVQSLLPIPLNEIATRLPSQTHALFAASAIERFLSRVDGVPPDWKAL